MTACKHFPNQEWNTYFLLATKGCQGAADCPDLDVCSWILPEPPSRDANGHDNEKTHLGEENKEEGKEVERAVTPRRGKNIITHLVTLTTFLWMCWAKTQKGKEAASEWWNISNTYVELIHQDGGKVTHLKALYTGRYQQMKEQGVKRRAQRMARPRPTPTPPDWSTQNMAKDEIRLKNSVPVQTVHRQTYKRRGMNEWNCSLSSGIKTELTPLPLTPADAIWCHLLLLLCCLLLGQDSRIWHLCPCKRVQSCF